MCTKPLMFDGFEAACRQCDECAATYKNTWVARAMAEGETAAYAYVFTLTYADTVNGLPPLGAKVYVYGDVARLWKRIRRAAERKLEKQEWTGEFSLRYIVVGEKGSRNGRCHYHGVMFSSHPLHELGTFKGAKTKGFAFQRRLDWDMWRHGFVEFDEWSKQSVRYCLKYILKGRMNAHKATGHQREGKTEWLATSRLWASKAPPIGADYLFQYLERLVRKGTCPTSLMIRIPGAGDWYVNGTLQQQMCFYLHDANKEFRQRAGSDLAGWATLIGSVSGGIRNKETDEITDRKPLEWLRDGEETETEKQTREFVERVGENASARIEAEHLEQRKDDEQWLRELHRKYAPCFGVTACARCQRRRSSADAADARQAEILSKGEYDALSDEQRAEQTFVEWQRRQGHVAAGCRHKGSGWIERLARNHRAVWQAGRKRL